MNIKHFHLIRPVYYHVPCQNTRLNQNWLIIKPEIPILQLARPVTLSLGAGHFYANIRMRPIQAQLRRAYPKNVRWPD